jgi:hypothetical protein
VTDILAAATAALHLALSPAVACDARPGTVVATIRVSGGDGMPVAMTISGGDVGDFALVGSDVVVAGAGIAPARCGSVRTVTIQATQP